VGKRRWIAPGTRVRTANPLTGCKWYPEHSRALRRAGAEGVVFPEVEPPGVHWVRHDDGHEAPYDDDELTEIPREQR